MPMMPGSSSAASMPSSSAASMPSMSLSSSLSSATGLEGGQPLVEWCGVGQCGLGWFGRRSRRRRRRRLLRRVWVVVGRRWRMRRRVSSRGWRAGWVPRRGGAAADVGSERGAGDGSAGRGAAWRWAARCCPAGECAVDGWWWPGRRGGALGRRWRGRPRCWRRGHGRWGRVGAVRSSWRRPALYRRQRRRRRLAATGGTGQPCWSTGRAATGTWRGADGGRDVGGTTAGMLPERDSNPDLAVAKRVLTGLIVGAAAARTRWWWIGLSRC
jgi:hypothetical protein